MKTIKQTFEKDCGAACLGMILEYYGRKVPLAVIRQDIRVDKDGTNLFGVISGAKKYNLNATSYSGSPEGVWVGLEKNKKVFPIIVRVLSNSVLSNKKYEHFVVATGIDCQKLKIIDPAIGEREMQKDEFKKSFLGEIVVFYPNDHFIKKNDRKNSYGRFIALISTQKKLLLASGLLSLAIVAIGMSGMFLFQYIIDNVLPYLSLESILEEKVQTLVILIFATGSMFLLKYVFSVMRAKLLTELSKNIDLPLMLGYYNHVSNLPLSFFEGIKTGEIMSRFDDAASIRDAVSSSIITITLDSLMVVVCGGILFKQSHSLFFVATVMLLVYLLITIVFIKPLKTINQEVMQGNALFTSYLKESVDGMEAAKVIGGEQEVRECVDSLYNNLIEKAIKSSFMNVQKESLIDLVTSIGTLVILWTGTRQVIGGQITFGTLMTFITLLSYFLDPVQDLAQLQGSFQTAVVAMDRLNDILLLEVEDRSGKDLGSSIDQIEMKNIAFRYGNRELVLNNFDFEAKKGQRIALIGESGCGKSTAAKILTGLYKPESGEITVNGVSVKELSSDFLRKEIMYIPQTTFLFSDTIYNNLFIGMDGSEVSASTLEAVLDACQCQFIKNLPLGIDTELEENGANLSGGMRQRIAIARALLHNPSVLILDESTSALDASTEYHLLTEIRNLFSDMTIITVTHRIQTIADFDQIYVIEKGRISGSGKHSNLLSTNSIYADLWSTQQSYKYSA